MTEEKTGNKTQPNYYAIIPANVRYCKDISSTAKLLYAEISCLTNFKGYCFAKNEYFAELYDISENRVSKIIKELKDNGFINISLKKNLNNFVTERIITLVDFKENNTEKKENNTSSPLAKITMDDGKNDISPLAKITTPIGKNDKYNIKSINNNKFNNNTSSDFESFNKISSSSESYDSSDDSVENNKSDLSEHNESHLVDKENDNNEKIVISSQSHDYSEITPTTAADIPFPEDVKEKKTKKVSKKADTPSFPRQDYKDIMDLYYQTRNELSSRMNVTDAIFKPNQTNALLKDYFTKYGVEKCKLAIKNASKHTWILNKTDFSIYSVFNKSMFEKFLEDTSVVTNKKLRHQMFFNDPKHSHIDYENQNYKEGY